MLSFKNYIQEVAEPKAGDEKRFKNKHVVQPIDHPANDAETLKGTKRSPGKRKRVADLEKGADEAVYEENMVKCEDCGEEYDAEEGEHECDMEESSCDKRKVKEETMTDTEMEKREEIVKGMKKDKEKLKKRYGDKWKSVMYATATKKAMGEEVEELDEISKDLARSYKYKASMSDPKDMRQYKARSKGIERANKRIKKKEQSDLGESIKVGDMQLKDGSTVKVSQEDAQAIESLYKNLNPANRKKMQEKLGADKKSFGEILAFAKAQM